MAYMKYCTEILFKDLDDSSHVNNWSRLWKQMHMQKFPGIESTEQKKVRGKPSDDNIPDLRLTPDRWDTK